MYEKMGDYATAEDMCERSLRIKMQVNGKNSIDVAAIHQNLCQIKIN